MSFSFERAEPPGPWGGVQPKFERIEYDGPRRFFLVGRLASGEPIRVRLLAGRYGQAPGGSPPAAG